MYGTISRMRVHPGKEQELMAQLHAFEAADVPGTVAIIVYQADRDPQEYYSVVMFASKEAYFANANSPAQQARYQEMVALLVEEPEWHDGTITYIMDHRY
jgi:quinol monooxygenase YgiN